MVQNKTGQGMGHIYPTISFVFNFYDRLHDPNKIASKYFLESVVIK